MGAEQLAALLKWPAIVGGILLLIYGTVKLIQRGAAKRATATDDLAEAEAQAAIQSKVTEVKRAHPKTARALRDALARKLRERRDQPKA